MIAPTRLATPEPSFRELFTPKLVTVFREGYDLGKLRADAFAGLTVAIVALPLSMAIAIASGVSPERGLYTAIVGGFWSRRSAAAGSRSAGRPAPSSCSSRRPIERHGIDGLLLATMIAGVDAAGRSASCGSAPTSSSSPIRSRRLHRRHRRHHLREPARATCSASSLPARSPAASCRSSQRLWALPGPSTRPPPRSPRSRSEPSCLRAATAPHWPGF